MKRLSLLPVLLLLALVATSQHKYEIGLEGGFLYKYYKLNDPTGQLEKQSKNSSTLPNGIGIIVFQINRPHHWVYKIGAGFYAINYNYSLNRNDVSYYGQGYAEQFFVMGSVGYKLSLLKKLTIVPLVGLALNVNNLYLGKQDYDMPYSTGIEFSSNTPPIIFPTVNGALELQYAASKRIKLILSGNYILGFTNRAEHYISYKVNNGPTQNATMNSRGSFSYLNIGIRYGFR